MTRRQLHHTIYVRSCPRLKLKHDADQIEDRNWIDESALVCKSMQRHDALPPHSRPGKVSI